MLARALRFSLRRQSQPTYTVAQEMRDSDPGWCDLSDLEIQTTPFLSRQV